MYKTASKNLQRGRESAAAKPTRKKKGKKGPSKQYLEGKKPRAKKALDRGYEPKRQDPAEIAERAAKRMQGVVVERKLRRTRAQP